MGRSNHLFELIQSLSQNEKGYFKKYCKLYSSQKDQKYLKLFEVVEKEKSYDDKAVQQKLKKEIDQKLFPVLKNYLYNLILKSLESYYAGKDPEIEIKNMISQIRILYNKGLYSHAIKGLKKARALAEKNELLYAIGELIALEQDILNKDADTEALYEKRHHLIETESKNLKKISNLIACKSFERRLVSEHWSKGIVQNDKIDLEDLYNDLGIHSQEEALTIKAKSHFNHASLLYYYVRNINFEKAFQFAEQNYQLINEYPDIFKQNRAKYIRIIYIYLGLCIPMKKEKQFLEGIDLLNKLNSNNSQIANELFDRKFNLILNFAIYFGRIEKGKESIEVFEKELPLYIQNLSYRSLTIFYHLSAYILHLAGDFDRALQFIQRIEQLTGNQARVDIKGVARIQDILIHFDLENWTLLQSKIRNTKRYLKKSKHYFQAEHLLLSALNNIAYNPNSEYLSVFTDLQAKLEKNRIENPDEINFLQYFDGEAWIQSKIEERSFSEVYSQKRLVDLES